MKWPRYRCMDASYDDKWESQPQYHYYEVWAPKHPMTATSSAEAALNADAWAYVAENWHALTAEGAGRQVPFFHKR